MPTGSCNELCKQKNKQTYHGKIEPLQKSQDPQDTCVLSYSFNLCPNKAPNSYLREWKALIYAKEKQPYACLCMQMWASAFSITSITQSLITQAARFQQQIIFSCHSLLFSSLFPFYYHFYSALSKGIPFWCQALFRYYPLILYLPCLRWHSIIVYLYFKKANIVSRKKPIYAKLFPGNRIRLFKKFPLYVWELVKYVLDRKESLMSESPKHIRDNQLACLKCRLVKLSVTYKMVCYTRVKCCLNGLLN